jgi:hypothetical protein
MRGSPVTERTNIRCERPFATSSPTLFACLVLLDGLFARRQHADSHVTPCWDGGGRFFLLDWPALEPQSTRPHMQKRRRSLRRPLLHARALCDHGAPRRSPQKPRVVDRATEVTYLPGSTAGVPEGRSAALIYAGAPVCIGIGTRSGQTVKMGM